MNKSAHALVLFVFLVAPFFLSAAEKPVVYNNVTTRSWVDELACKALETKFTILETRESEGYLQPKYLSGKFPRAFRTSDGKVLGGYVLVTYVVSLEGKVLSPLALKSDDPLLSAEALKAIENWRFEPATLHGNALASIAAQEFHFETTPTEFVTQVLEPLGGKIQRPKEWFYTESHRNSVYMWTISREDSSAGHSYNTGVRIQVFTGVKKGAGKTPKQFLLDFVESKKKEATKVIETCEPKDQGLFTRLCLQTEEGDDRILYSLFWGSNDMDLAIIIISGTSTDLWDIYRPVFDRMSSMELIDMKRFEK